jgi:hypothetical protein
VKLPGGEKSGYRKALRNSEEACQLEPKDGIVLNTLGMAYYRVGNYEKAPGNTSALGSDLTRTSSKAQSPPSLPCSQ